MFKHQTNRPVQGAGRPSSKLPRPSVLDDFLQKHANTLRRAEIVRFKPSRRLLRIPITTRSTTTVDLCTPRLTTTRCTHYFASPVWMSSGPWIMWARCGGGGGVSPDGAHIVSCVDMWALCGDGRVLTARITSLCRLSNGSTI